MLSFLAEFKVRSATGMDSHRSREVVGGLSTSGKYRYVKLLKGRAARRPPDSARRCNPDPTKCRSHSTDG